jgi:hypothetical protein
MGEVSSDLQRFLAITPVLPGFQSACKVNDSEQSQVQKWKEGCQAFLLLLVN